MKPRSKGSPADGLSHDVNQTRRVGMFLNSSMFDFIDPGRETRQEEIAEGDARGEGTSPLHPLEGQFDPFTGMASNPAVSGRQQRFMAMCAHNPGKAHGRCPSKAVAEEFSHRG